MTSYGEISVTGLEHSLVHNCVSLRMQLLKGVQIPAIVVTGYDFGKRRKIYTI